MASSKQITITPPRRAFLRWVMGASAASTWASNAFASPIEFGPDAFALGVSSGSPTPDGFVIWTRLIGPALRDHPDIPVKWAIWDPDKPGHLIQQGVAVAKGLLAHSVHVEVAGLEPNRWYAYRFMIGDASSRMGLSRTLPRQGTAVGHWRLAYASCQRWEHGYYAAYRHMLADHPDLVVFLGDYIYEYAGRHNPGFARTHALPRIESLQDYRDRYALYRSDPDLQRMHAACPWIVTWDDHEVENNYAGELSTLGYPDLPSRRLAAYQAFYEHMPLRRKALTNGLAGLLKGHGLRLYTTLDIGRLARLYLLDNRQYRDAPWCNESIPANLFSACSAMPDSERSMLGRSQERWLHDALAESVESKIEWNLLAQQTRFTPANYPSGHSKGFNPDGWDGYPESRERLIAALVSTHARNPIILGGDIHQNWIAHVHQDPYDVSSPVVAREFIGTSISSQGAHQRRTDRLAERNPHCIFSDSQRRGYGLVDLTPNRLDVTLRVVSDEKDQQASVNTLARFYVTHDDPTIKRQ